MSAQEPRSEPDVVADVAYAGPPFDRWMYVVLRGPDGKYVWSCHHRHHTFEPVRRCARRALAMKMLREPQRRRRDQWLTSTPVPSMVNVTPPNERSGGTR